MEEEESKVIEYVRPLGQISRFECPANKDLHSKYLNSYEMYKYHIKYCRELRDLPEVFICKFCVKLFLQSNKRDIHQSNCSCRLVQDNTVFEMPDHLKNSYPQNKITFENQEEFYEILTYFPKQEPLSIHLIEGNSVNQEEDTEEENVQLRGEKSCCEKDSNQAISEDQIDNEEDQSMQDENNSQLMQSNDVEVSSSSQNILMLNTQIDSLFVQDQISQNLNTSQDDSEFDFKKPSRKKHSARRFKNIVKRKENRPNPQPNLEQGNMTNTEQNLEKSNQDNIYKNEQSNKSSTPIPYKIQTQPNNISQDFIMIDEDIQTKNSYPGREEDSHNNKMIDENSDVRNKVIQQPKKQGQLPLQNIKIIKVNKMEKQEIKNPLKDVDMADIYQQECLLEQFQKEQQSRKPIDIKIIDFVSVKHMLLKEEINHIKDHQYLKYLSSKNFQKYNSYLFKNLSNLNPKEHLIATYSISAQNDIQYIHQNFMKKQSDSQFCLMQIELTKIQNFFTQQQPYICTFNQNNNQKCGSIEYLYKSNYAIFIITLENSQILEADFVPSPPQNALDCTDDFMKPIQIQELQQQNQLGNSKILSQSALSHSQSINNLSPLKVNLYVYEGFQVWNYDLKLNQVFLSEKLTKDLLETAAIDLKIWDRYRSQTEKQLQQYSNDIENFSKMKEERKQQLLEITKRIELGKEYSVEKRNKRMAKEKSLQEKIQNKMNEKENNLLKYNQMQKDIVDLKNQVSLLQERLTQEIEKEYKSVKDKSDQIYNQQVEKHKNEIISLASENISDQSSILDRLKKESKLLMKEQYELIDVQRKQGQILLKYDQKTEKLLNIKREKDKLIQTQKNQSQTAYLCIVCKKYPQNCLQKPCGHVVCCYTCLNAQNDEQEIIFCKVCNIEIIKFSEIKYKILHH